MNRFSRKQQLIIIGSVVGVLLIIVLVTSLWARNRPNPGATAQYGPTDHTYVDPYSHETVSSPEGKSPENYGYDPNTPGYLGFDKLIDHGFSYEQISALKTALQAYPAFSGGKAKEISLHVDDATTFPPDPNDPNGVPYFISKITVNRKATDTYQIRVITNSDNIHLYIYDEKGQKLLFDSGVVQIPATENQ